MNKENKKPNFLFRVAAFLIAAAMVVIIIILTYSTNNLKKDMESLNEELDRERLESEELRQRLDKEMDEDAIREEAKVLGYSDPDDMIFDADVPNS